MQIIGDVRGKGLMINIEMVQDKTSKYPLNPERTMKIWEECREMGVLIGRAGVNFNVFGIKPPMCITKEDVDFALQVFKRALDNSGN